jgi:predicted DNA-binding ribbon-helix-helix protein
MGTRRSVVLTDPQVTYLQAEAERLGITVADLIRRIIDRYREADGADAVKQREAAE